MKPLNIICGLFIIFLLSACGASTTSKTVNVYTGTSGLIAEFLPNAPPAKVFTQSAFPIGLKIRNSGTYNIQNNEGMMAMGFEKDYIPSIKFDDSNGIYQASENQVAFSIAGKTNFNQAGDEVVITSTAKTGNLEEQSESKSSLLTATLCYPYKTTLSATMCIDPDVVGLRPGKKICAVKDVSLSGGQGAPIAITRIEPVMVPEVDNQNIRPQFLIYIENKASGTPVDKEKYRNVCDKKDSANTNMQKDNIWNVGSVKAFASGPSGEVQLQCCPNRQGECPEKEVAQNELEGFLRFRDNKDFIRCTFTNTVKRNLDAYTSPLRIEIDYGYVQTITVNTLLQKPLRH